MILQRHAPSISLPKLHSFVSPGGTAAYSRGCKPTEDAGMNQKAPEERQRSLLSKVLSPLRASTLKSTIPLGFRPGLYAFAAPRLNCATSNHQPAVSHCCSLCRVQPIELVAKLNRAGPKPQQRPEHSVQHPTPCPHGTAVRTARRNPVELEESSLCR